MDSKGLSAVQRLNKLPVGTYIKFHVNRDGEDTTYYAQKQMIVEVGYRDEFVWKNPLRSINGIGLKSEKIPTNFEIVSEKEVELAKLEQKLENARELLGDCDVLKDIEKKVLPQIAALKKELIAERINSQPTFEEKIKEAKAIKAQQTHKQQSSREQER